MENAEFAEETWVSVLCGLGDLHVTALCVTFV